MEHSLDFLPESVSPTMRVFVYVVLAAHLGVFVRAATPGLPCCPPDPRGAAAAHLSQAFWALQCSREVSNAGDKLKKR